MYENHFPQSGKYQIRRARQVSAVEAKAIAESVRDSPNDQLGLGVLAPDRRHVAAPLLARVHVHLSQSLPDNSEKSVHIQKLGPFGIAAVELLWNDERYSVSLHLGKLGG